MTSLSWVLQLEAPLKSSSHFLMSTFCVHSGQSRGGKYINLATSEACAYETYEHLKIWIIWCDRFQCLVIQKSSYSHNSILIATQFDKLY